MQNDPTTPVKNVTGRSRTSALWTRITERCTRIKNLLDRHAIDLWILVSLTGGAILFLMAMRAISDVT